MEELFKKDEFYNNALKALKAIPESYRSRNHTEYLNELTERVDSLGEAINFVLSRNLK